MAIDTVANKTTKISMVIPGNQEYESSSKKKSTN